VSSSRSRFKGLLGGTGNILCECDDSRVVDGIPYMYGIPRLIHEVVGREVDVRCQNPDILAQGGKKRTS